MSSYIVVENIKVEKMSKHHFYKEVLDLPYPTGMNEDGYLLTYQDGHINWVDEKYFENRSDNISAITMSQLSNVLGNRFIKKVSEDSSFS
jgi:hypothetical protein